MALYSQGIPLEAASVFNFISAASLCSVRVGVSIVRCFS